MTAPAGDILSDIRDVLLGTGAFAAVSLAPDADSARWPRAEVTLSGLDESPADDRPAAGFATLTARVRVCVQSADPAAALERALALGETARAALLTDRFRGGRCRDLPTGPATEVGPARLDPAVRAPYLALNLELRCRFER